MRTSFMPWLCDAPNRRLPSIIAYAEVPHQVRRRKQQAILPPLEHHLIQPAETQDFVTEKRLGVLGADARAEIGAAGLHHFGQASGEGEALRLVAGARLHFDV